MALDVQQTQSVNSSTFSITFLNLQFSTQYRCCVSAVYTNSSENASSCALGATDGKVM